MIVVQRDIQNVFNAISSDHGRNTHTKIVDAVMSRYKGRDRVSDLRSLDFNKLYLEGRQIKGLFPNFLLFG